MDVREKLNILSAAAKYDVSCTSSGSRRSAPPVAWATHALQAFAILGRLTGAASRF